MANNVTAVEGMQGTNIAGVSAGDTVFYNTVNAEFGTSINSDTWINDEQSQGGDDAEIATYDNDQRNTGNAGSTTKTVVSKTEAFAFNSPPYGAVLKAAFGANAASTISSQVTNYYASNEVLTDSWIARGVFAGVADILDLFSNVPVAAIDVGTKVELAGPDYDPLTLITSMAVSAIIDAHDPKSALAGLLTEANALGGVYTNSGTLDTTTNYLQIAKAAYAGVAASRIPQLDSLFGQSSGTLSGAIDYSGASTFIQAVQSNIQSLNAAINGDYSQTEAVQLENDLENMVDGYTVVQSGNSWSSIASIAGMSVSAFQALNSEFLSGPGTTGVQQLTSLYGNIGTNAVIRTPTAMGTGVPPGFRLQGLTPNQVCLYNINTDRWYVTDALLDGSDAGLFEVIDDYGDVLGSYTASTVSSIAITPFYLTSGGVQVSLNNGSAAQTIQLYNVTGRLWYDVQPGDGTLSSIAGLLGENAQAFEAANGGGNATPAAGTQLREVVTASSLGDYQVANASFQHYTVSAGNDDDLIDVSSDTDYTIAPSPADNGLSNTLFVTNGTGAVLNQFGSDHSLEFTVANSTPPTGDATTTYTIDGLSYVDDQTTGTVTSGAADAAITGNVQIAEYQYNSSLDITDTSGSGAITNVTGDVTWQAGAGTDTLSFGSAVADALELVLNGSFSQYTISISGSTVTIADTVAGRNGTKTIQLNGASGSAVFLGNTRTFAPNVDLGTINDTYNLGSALASPAYFNNVDYGGTATHTLIGNMIPYSIAITNETIIIQNGLSSDTSPEGQLTIINGATNMLWFTQSGNDLIIQQAAQTGKIDFQNWFVNSYSQVSAIVMNSVVNNVLESDYLAASSVAALVSAMATYQQAHSNFNITTASSIPSDPGLVAALDSAWLQTITGSSGSDTLTGTVGTDTLVGRQGNDTLNGGAGQTTYREIPGDGQDVVTNFKTGTSGDTVQLVGSTTPVTTTGHNLSDVLFDNGSNSSYLWEMQGASVVGGGAMNYNYTSGWMIAGVGVFSPGAKAQTLWVNSAYNADLEASSSASGDTSGNYTVTNTALASNAQSSKTWIADFNDDGAQDILWDKGQAAPYLWEMSGSGVVNGGALNYTPGAAWSIAGVGDFFHNGSSGIILIGGSGSQVQMLTITNPNAKLSGSQTFNVSQTVFTQAAVSGKIWVGDFNGDGNADILWDQGGTTAPVLWEMNGTTIIGQATLGYAPGSGWHIAGVGDFDGIGTTQVMWIGGTNGTQMMLWTPQITMGAVNNSTIPVGTPQILQSAAITSKIWTGDFNGEQNTFINGSGSQVELLNTTSVSLTSNNVQSLSTIRDYSAQTTGVTASIATGVSSVAGDDLYGFTGIKGTSSADTLEGKGTAATPSVLSGNGGADNYWFNSGDGAVQINNGVSTSNTAAGQVDFLGSLTDENLWFLKSGNNLVADLIGTKDQVTINNYYTSGDTYAQVSQFDAGGLKLDTQLATLVQAMATYSANNSGFNPQTATAMPTDPTLQNAISAAWHS